MSVTTKTGDSGETSLATGERVPKDYIRVQVYGTVDELNSFLGLAKHGLAEREFKLIEKLQKDLFRVAGELAKADQYVRLITFEETEELTRIIQDYEKLVDLNSFVIPGATINSAYLDVCRTVARRAERLFVTLMRQEPVRKELEIYLNRLSDLLYVLARYVEGDKMKRIRGNEL